LKRHGRKFLENIRMAASVVWHFCGGVRDCIERLQLLLLLLLLLHCYCQYSNQAPSSRQHLNKFFRRLRSAILDKVAVVVDRVLEARANALVKVLLLFQPQSQQPRDFFEDLQRC
jgi:hypothetical protein